MKRSRGGDSVPIINTQTHLQELYYVEPLLMAYQHKIYTLEEELKELRDSSDSLVEYGEEIVN